MVTTAGCFAGRGWPTWRQALRAALGGVLLLPAAATAATAAEPADPRPRMCWQMVDAVPSGVSLGTSLASDELRVTDGAHPFAVLRLAPADRPADPDPPLMIPPSRWPCCGSSGIAYDSPPDDSPLDEFVVAGRDPQLVLRWPGQDELLWIWARHRGAGMRRLSVRILPRLPPDCAARSAGGGPMVVLEALAESRAASCVGWPLTGFIAGQVGPSCFPTAVPDLVGRPLAEAEAILERLELVLGTVDERPHLGPPTVVLEQDPRPTSGLDLATGDAIDLVVAGQRLVAVPDLVGWPVAAAAAELEPLELRLEARSRGASVELESIADYEITRQDPGSGEIVPAGGAVQTEVAWRLPDLRGLPVAAAARRLRAQGHELRGAGLASGDAADEDQAAFSIASHRPAGGELAAFGQPIEAELAVAVPRLVGLTPAVAQQRLAARSLRLERLTPPPPESDRERILDQTPAALTPLAPGDTVTVDIGVVVPRIEWRPASGVEAGRDGSVGEAMRLLSGSGLQLGLDAETAARWRDDVGRHRLRDQRPRPGAVVARDSEVGAGLEVRVPNLLWTQAAEAESGLRALGFEPRRPRPRAPGSLRYRVVGQSPPAGAWLLSGRPVQLTLGPGLAPPLPEPRWPWPWALAVAALGGSMFRLRRVRRLPAKLRVEGHSDFGRPRLEAVPEGAGAAAAAIRLRPRWDSGRQTLRASPSKTGGTDV